MTEVEGLLYVKRMVNSAPQHRYPRSATGYSVWVRIANGELDGVQALSEGRFRVKGDPVLLEEMGEWFTSAPRS